MHGRGSAWKPTGDGSTPAQADNRQVGVDDMADWIEKEGLAG